jgi:hypothetical protein
VRVKPTFHLHGMYSHSCLRNLVQYDIFSCCQLDPRCIQKVCCAPSKQTKFQLPTHSCHLFLLVFATIAHSRRAQSAPHQQRSILSIVVVGLIPCFYFLTRSPVLVDRYRIITKLPSWTCPGPSCADSKPCQGGRTLYRWTHSEVWIPAGKGRQFQ